nr:PREDICTED: uncharacterized aarF domain-containing protein kinase 2 isoform X2 [Latimeria chalumnae]|eukprot:XP_006001291.1 PREDICTED: uncharacterized aarF domain-containing protein kinase 2 isoform X2 [Latimeria chalumnae]
MHLSKMISLQVSARYCLTNFRTLIGRRHLPSLRTDYKSIRLLLGGRNVSKLKALPRITFICLGVRHASCTLSSQNVSVSEEKLLKQPLSAKKNPLVRLFWKLQFGLLLGLRALVLFLKFGPLLLLYPFCCWSVRLVSFWLDLLLRMIESSGPAFIKLGQWASTRRDIFSEEFCDKFSKLHVRVTPHSWGYTKHCLKRAFGEDWKRMFLFESKKPIGSGCVAQVYRAFADVVRVNDPEFQKLVENYEKEDTLEAWEVSGGLGGILRYFWRGRHEEALDDNGNDGSVHVIHMTRDESERRLPSTEELEDALEKTIKAAPSLEKNHLLPVAIKVLHPGIAYQVQMDLWLMKIGSWAIGLLPGLKWLSLTEIVEEFEKLMTRQIDLRNEAQNMERFHENFQDVDFVKFPTPLRPFITRNILVETFEVFVDNFVHGDLHPGNILVQGLEPSTTSHDDMTTIVDLCDTLIVNIRPCPSPLKLVLLDGGIVAQLQESDLENFKAVFTAVALGQGEKVAELILHHARASDCRDKEQFKLEMAELVKEARESAITLRKVQVADLLSRVFKLLITHKVKLESNFASIVFAIMILEGLGRTLDPDLDILEVARPLLLKNAASFL